MSAAVACIPHFIAEGPTPARARALRSAVRSARAVVGEALIRTPLRELGDALDPARFWQIHRATIVNLVHVKATERDFSGRITLTLKARPERIAVSRAYAHRFKQM
jgi:DNA-binding LytR/AlgR family response regulator